MTVNVSIKLNSDSSGPRWTVSGRGPRKQYRSRAQAITESTRRQSAGKG